MTENESRYEEALRTRANVFKDFLLPVALCDTQLTVRWSNTAFMSLYPALAEPEGIRRRLAEYGPETVFEKLEREGAFVIRGSFDLASARLNVVPLVDVPPNSGIIGAIVVVVNDAAMPGSEEVALRSNAPLFVEQSFRRNMAALFEALDAAALKADMLDMGWIKPNLDAIAKRGYSMLRGNRNFTSYMQLFAAPRELSVSYMELFTEIRLFAPIGAGLAKDAGIPLRFDLPEEAGVIGGDVAKVQLAFLNLLHNALRHTREGNEVLVSGKADKGFVTLTVEDRGAGIPESILPQVFIPFFATSYKGFSAQGLGLTVAKMAVEAHGGTLKLVSEENVGTTASMTLPRNLFGVKARLKQESATSAATVFPGDRFSQTYIGLADL
jgi:anti-sigma regulatory factor (Ser/Thr protein kinase)